MKRIIESIVSALALLILAPLLILIAIAIKLDSRGPVFFRQQRVGKDCNLFDVIKFRTMNHREHIDQHAESVIQGGTDSRITRVGRLLRMSSVDELPQLINILNGEMSLVGPRPILPEQMEVVPENRMGRFDVRPGITGLAQVNGRRGLDWMKQLEYDTDYAAHHNLLQDLRIVCRTFIVVLTGSGIYADASKNWRAYRQTATSAAPTLAENLAEEITFMIITNNPVMADQFISAGVNRLFVDMETLGKEERQGHLNTHRASHTPDDVRALRNAIPTASIMTRINPLHDDSIEEIDAIISAGTDYIMLPMFETAEEVDTFLSLVDGRAKTTLLLETPQSLVRIDEILEHYERIDEIHIGLNDLHLGMRLDFMFELLGGGLVDYLANKIRARNIRFGFGGISRIGGNEAAPANLVMGEHVRLGSEMVILSRSFHQQAAIREGQDTHLDIASEIQKLRECERAYRNASAEELEHNRSQLQQSIRVFVKHRRDTSVETA
ncbi:aldolase/citrate lyase family protein [Pusillimonas sp. ANT_WB101]|uniref:aldolase/citrate lyase family protein n=1 Tax=Pusillimonas sp. ANT_WB101 TaxID=2597356 RepID=UPI0011EFC249|nr:aldolase/citrate lyase family protein [Pusillimonas sp. ANT_WB101]KAA0911329.1 hypothetical protein FQ179_05675 [Pusillimonas sp. ANT_WB101]